MSVPIEQLNALLEETTIGELIKLAVNHNGNGAGLAVARRDPSRFSPSVQPEGQTARLGRTPAEAASADQPQAQNVFRNEGASWHLTFAGYSVKVKPRTGLDYIAHLLANPSRRIPAISLYLRVNGRSSTAAQAAPTTDPAAGRPEAIDSTTTDIFADSSALSQYHHRLAELEGEIQQAERHNDEGRALSLECEHEKLLRFLQVSTDGRGSARKFSDPQEKARKRVSNAISRAISKLSEEHPALGQHLGNSISTGYTATYNPEEKRVWQF